MIVPDTNLLPYAYDLESPFCERARQWWTECLKGNDAREAHAPGHLRLLAHQHDWSNVPTSAICQAGVG